MLGARATRFGRAVVTIVTGAILWSSIATVALAVDKTFSATVAPGALVAGASYGEGARAASKVTLTIVNESNQARLGSANVTPPTGIAATAATSSVGTVAVVGGVIQLRTLELAPGANVSVAISARVECGSNHANYVWGFAVKQANDFNGTGNDLVKVGPATANTVTGNCAVAFSKQPKSAEKNAVITNAFYDPDGDAVTVTVMDGAGVDTVRWWSGSVDLSKGNDPTIGDVAILSGTSGTGSAGNFTFAPRLNLTGTGYTVRAKATPTPDTASEGTSAALATSLPFNIVDDADICTTANSTCRAHTAGPKTDVTIDAAAGGEPNDLVALSINDPDIDVDCAGYAETSENISYDVTDSEAIEASDRPKVATFILGAASVTKAASKYDVCYRSTMQFPTKSGALALLDPESGLYEGLLPACVNKTIEPAPCVVSKTIDKFKRLVIVVSSPPGDPQARF